MRGWSIALAVLLTTTGLAGCIGTSTEDVGSQSTPSSVGALDPSSIQPPENATVEDVQTGVKVLLEDVDLPFRADLEIPQAATVVDVQANVSSDSAVVYPAMFNAETGDMRCTTAFASGWESSPTGTSSCAGVTAIDPASSTWQVSVSSPANVTAEQIEIHLYDEPLDGIVGELNLSNLSMPHHDIGETTTHRVDSHDGSQLFLEVHKPAGGHQAYPTVLISTPYNTLTRIGGGQPYASVIEDFVKRGYVVAIADVRGFGQSEGCVEVWGANERQDQAALVEWITQQDFSDGHVGMMGVSYVGTTPVEAAVEAPEGLDAVIPVAGVVNAYKDWHYGGVPTGENLGSPAAYQAIGVATTPRPMNPVATAVSVGNGLCDPTLAARANDPRAVYDEFYETRNFSTRAENVEAAVLQQHGFVDGTVKPNVIHNWFDELDTPKLAMLGHWSHNWAVRADQATLRLAWMDQFVKGQEMGLANVSQVSIETNDGYQDLDEWPPEDNTPTQVYPAFGEGKLATNATEGSATLLLDPTGQAGQTPVTAAGGDDQIVLTGTLEEPVGIAGKPYLRLDATLEGAANAYVHASLYEVQDDGDRMITYGASNLAHRGNHSTYEPFAPGERAKVPLPMQPTDYRLEAGDEIRLVIEASEATGLTRGTNPGQLVLHGGEEGTQLKLPSLPPDTYASVPITVDPSPAR